MPQRYKLRLSDGTILLVDVGGLNTWLADDKAMVQAAGGWRPLKEVLALAAKRAAAKQASQQESSASAALPLVYPEPRKKESSGRAALPLVYPPPRGAKAPHGLADPSWGDPVAPASTSDPVGVQALAEDPTGPAHEGTTESTADEGLPIDPYKPLYEDEGPQLPRLPESFSQSEPLALSSTEPVDVRAWLDELEPAIPSTEPLSHEAPPDEEAAVIPPRPLYEEDEAREPPIPPPWRDPIEPPSISARPSLQVLADDPHPRDGYTGPPSTYDDGPPRISLKPLDDRDEAYAPAPSQPRVYEDDQDDVLEERPRGFVLDQGLVRAVDAFGGFLSWCFDHLDRWYRRLRSRVPDAPTTWRAAASWPSAPDEPHPSVSVPLGVQVLAEEPTGPREDTRLRAIADEGPPVIRLKPLDGDGAPLRAAQEFLRSLRSKALAWASGLRGQVARLARRYRSGPSRPSDEPAVLSAADPAPFEALRAPLPLSELPGLRLVTIDDEPKQEEDVYEGERESLFQTAWYWTKGILFISGLVAGGTLAVLNWETWFPKAAHLGGVAFTEVGEQLRVREQAEREQQALRETTDRLPHLAAQTIRLILSGSPTGVLDPAEVFQRACDAADRGLSALTSEEAEELSLQQSALLDTLSPAAGEHLREYDRVRARRATFAFEDRSALERYARGARALPPESRERLQALYGKAVAAGLALPTEIAPGAVARR